MPYPVVQTKWLDSRRISFHSNDHWCVISSFLSLQNVFSATTADGNRIVAGEVRERERPETIQNDSSLVRLYPSNRRKRGQKRTEYPQPFSFYSAAAQDEWQVFGRGNQKLSFIVSSWRNSIIVLPGMAERCLNCWERPWQHQQFRSSACGRLLALVTDMIHKTWLSTAHHQIRLANQYNTGMDFCVGPTNWVCACRTRRKEQCCE